jgi:hypothetical protein
VYINYDMLHDGAQKLGACKFARRRWRAYMLRQAAAVYKHCIPAERVSYSAKAFF